MLSQNQIITELEQSGADFKGLANMSKSELFYLYKEVFNLTPSEVNTFEFELSSVNKIKSILRLHENIYGINIYWKYCIDKQELLKVVNKFNVKFIDLENPDTFELFMFGGYDSIK